MKSTTISIVVILSCIAQLVSGQVLRHSSYKCLAPEGSTTTPENGTFLIHTSNCRDRSAFFTILASGAIQHKESGLCVHLTGERNVPRNREMAVLRSGCSDTKYFFRHMADGSIQHVNSNKCLRPTSKRMREGVKLHIYSGCGESVHQYNFVDIKQGCDLACLDEILKAKQNTKTFDEFFLKSEKEARTLSSVSVSFFLKLRKEIPELYQDVFSTFYPVDGRVIENLEKLINHFGIAEVKRYPSLFLGAAFSRRKGGVAATELAPCGGTGRQIGGVPVIDEVDAYVKSKLNGNELRVMLEQENYKAKEAIDKERETDEQKGINTDDFKISPFQKWIDHFDSKYYYKLWTKESLEEVRKLCQFTDVSQIKFPPRGFGMSAIEYLEYFMSRNQSLFPQTSLNFPWPLSIALTIDTSIRECNWIWRRLENGERIVRYSKYSSNYKENDVRCNESDWNICSIPRIIEDGGVCGRQSQLARVTNKCLGIPSGGIKQPGHAALYLYTKNDGRYNFKIQQGITNMLNTYAVWHLMDDGLAPSIKPNAEYHKGLTAAMNHGYKSYREGRIALLLYSRIYDEQKRREAREILIEALENNPHMMDVWMKLIHDISGNRALPREGQNVLARLPSKCPEHFSDSQRGRLLILVNKYLSSYMQMYLDVLLRLISPPSCCSPDKPRYLDILKEALDKESREIVKDYLFEGYALCAAKSSSVQEFLEIIEPRALAIIAGNNDEEMEAFSDIIRSVDNFVSTRDQIELSKQSVVLAKFYSDICGALPKIHVTATTWIVLKQYKECANFQLKFLKRYIRGDYSDVAQQLQALEDTSAKNVSFWSQLYNNGWLYGRSVDIVPILTEVKICVNGGKFKEHKVNIAKGKSAIMSSTLQQGREAYRAVDGKMDQNIGGGSCASTKKEMNPWFVLDLGSPTKVFGLLISNANDKHGKYLHSFEIHVGNSKNKSEVINEKCGTLHALRPGETKAIFCNPAVSGRYVTINIPRRKTVMTICEVQVFDSQLTRYFPHGVKLNLWRNIRRGSLEKFYKNQRYPDHPDATSVLDTIKFKNLGNNYGSQLSTLYRAPETGSFKFHAICDDQCEFFIKDVESVNKYREIISLQTRVSLNEWNKYPEQNSTEIHLQRGKYYKLVATLYDRAGQDFILLGVTLPSGKFVFPLPPKDLFIDTSGGKMDILSSIA